MAKTVFKSSITKKRDLDTLCFIYGITAAFFPHKHTYPVAIS